MSSFVTDGPAGPEGALPLTGERTIPGLAEENYWFRRHEVVYQRLRDRCEDRDVVVLKNGFPLNSTGGCETGSVDDIAPTRAAMLLGAAQALKETAPGLRDANVDAQRRVAKALGREL